MTTKHQFTPGEWTRKGHEVLLGRFTLRHHWDGGAKPSEMEANARLITSSPTLYEACEAALRVAEGLMRDAAPHPEDQTNDNADYAAAKSFRDLVQAALAKATLPQEEEK